MSELPDVSIAEIRIDRTSTNSVWPRHTFALDVATPTGRPVHLNNAAVPTGGEKESDTASHMRFDLREEGFELFSEDRAHE
jgi:hypothetical protein